MISRKDDGVNIVCAPTGIIPVKRPGRGIAYLSDAGFENMLLDFSLCCPPEELVKAGKGELASKPGRRNEEVRCTGAAENNGDDSKENIQYSERIKEGMLLLAEQCKKSGMQMKIAHAPYLPRNYKDSNLNALLTVLAKESIRVCAQAGCQCIVIRPLSAGIPDEDIWSRNREYYMELAEAAQKYDVQILLENQCKDRNGHLVRGICADIYEAISWVDSFNETLGQERFGFCMDVGVSNLCGQNMYDLISGLGERLKAVILRDSDGNHENALLPFTSADNGQAQTDWLGLIRGLRERGFAGEMIIDMKDTLSAFPPFLHPELLKWAKTIADYFKWQIGMENVLKKYPSRVLFGAGNMCRNYMKCYGEKYPPLYTCDNDSSIWGTVFCGLEVKNPQSLKELPEECAVFICNVYYEEIRDQLQEMGIRNPIEYFSDEYMPSYYFDRLEMKNI
ncbi:MAG: sugar phosphate isomerase/epimerase [Lachnospiraceae bacterium]|nr:sugar phosphate isomerase/epimerase [Lachnospiraceae bacterium]